MKKLTDLLARLCRCNTMCAPESEKRDMITTSSVFEIPPLLEKARCIRKLPQHMRAGCRNPQVYDPVVLSIGPYHNQNPLFSQMEKIKQGMLDQFSSDIGGGEALDTFLREILEMITDNRIYDAEEASQNNEALAKIILRDACFLISYMEKSSHTFREISNQLGMPTAVHVRRDFWIAENQIPFGVIQRLSLLKNDNDLQKANKILYEYLSRRCFWNDQKLTSLPWDEGSQPLHLLEARRSTLLHRTVPRAESHFLTKLLCICKRYSKTSSSRLPDHESNSEILNLPHRSVTYLKAKGIYFMPSSHCLRDFTFTSYMFFGVLHLPIFLIDSDTQVFLHNIVAFEMSPGSSTDGAMISYVNFMQSLIDTPKDVKELRERGVLYSTLGNDEEVVKVFKEINTYGLNNSGTFGEVRRAINKHCNSKGKTWMAELFHNYFRSPWAVIALFAATFVICLTFLQTYYTINPAAKT